ncbi:hypothetical protein HBI72_021710 [Parastagonospora nodorum]|nr:hypothetical protein HBI72_021710 [Parastagonospora nodorum]
MRLINARTLEIVEFLSEGQIPPFVILSHTWEDEECTLQQMQASSHTEIYRRKGYKKIQSCCKQALKDGFEWAWIDTCCIDKTSTAELSEAINSMFRWYRIAQICYAFLADVHDVTRLASSRWFTRGWTLQELVAPSTLWFYDFNWQFLGSKDDLRKELEKITSIDIDVLANGSIESISIARRMSWAAKRQTTRIEDQAYSLLGIFDVNMPLLYGEGKKAFRRLQEEIMKISDDQSLFAWGLPDRCKTARQLVATSAPSNLADMHGLFADSPADFSYTDRIHVLGDFNTALPPLVTNNGVRIELPIFTETQSQLHFAVICCTLEGWFRYYLAFPMIPWNSTWHARCGELVLIAVTDLVPTSSSTPYGRTSVVRIKSPTAPITESTVSNIIRLVDVADIYGHPYQLIDVHCSAHATHDVMRNEIRLNQDKDGLHAVFAYDSTTIDPMLMFSSIGFDRRLKAKAGSKLHITHSGDTTVVTSHGESSLDRFKYFYRPFAVLVGGTIKDPWAKTMLILNDDNPDSDFHQMYKTSEDFVRSCITKKQLVSLVQEEKADNPLLQHRTYHDSHPVLHWEWNGPIMHTRSATKRLHVHANVQIVSANLVEHSLALFVELKDTEIFTETERPTWWSSNSEG